MQRGRANVGRASVSMSGRNATKLSNTPQPQPQSYKPNEYGKPGTPRTIDVPPASSYQRPQASGAQPVRSGSRVVADVTNQQLIGAGKVSTNNSSGTPFPGSD